MSFITNLLKITQKEIVFDTHESEDIGEPIDSYIQSGEERLIPRKYWRLKILPDQFRKNWNTPDILYSLIVDALQTGFFLETLQATVHLLEIDNDKERSYAVRSISLLKNKMLNESAETLEKYLKLYGDNGVILCNYAKVFAEKNEQTKAEAILLHSLNVDPNQKNALEWWGAIHHERNKEQGFIDAMKMIVQIEGSWRPQLWLAKKCLESNDLSGALKFYKTILSFEDLPGDALTQISGDLGKNAYINECVELIENIYDPVKHGYLTGFNLITSYIQLNRKKEAYLWLSKLRSLNHFDIVRQLNNFEAQLNGMPRDCSE